MTINEQRILVGDRPKGCTDDSQTINHLVTSILKDDLTTVVPLVLTGQDEQKPESVITPEVLEGLKQLPYLADLNQQVQSREQDSPLPPDIDALLRKAAEALATILGVIDVLGSQAILYQHSVQGHIKTLLEELDTSHHH